jgi:hypothetical protein
MSEEKKPAPPRGTPQGVSATYSAASMAAAEKPLATASTDGAIPVALVRFDRAFQYPGEPARDMARTERMGNGAGTEVVYLPALAHFRITYTNPHDPKRSGVAYVPTSRVLCWEPA